MYQDERRLDFRALGKEIKRKREAKGWTQEYLAQLRQGDGSLALRIGKKAGQKNRPLVFTNCIWMV